MTNASLLGMILLTSGFAQAQEFEVATIKPTAPDWNGGRYMRMKSANQFEAKNYTLKVLLSVAYNLSAPEILGGPDWVDSDRYDILGKTPGDARPTPDQQMAMLRKLIADQFDLAFHRERRETSIYSLTVLIIDRRQERAEADREQSSARYPCRTSSAAAHSLFRRKERGCPDEMRAWPSWPLCSSDPSITRL